MKLWLGITLIVVALVGGAAVGYFIAKSMNKKDGGKTTTGDGGTGTGTGGETGTGEGGGTGAPVTDTGVKTTA